MKSYYFSSIKINKRTQLLKPPCTAHPHSIATESRKAAGASCELMYTRRNRIASRALWLMILLMITTVIGRAERVTNSSSAGLFWSTAKEDEDLLRKAEPNDDSTAAAIVNDHDEFDGGFSSIDGMLQWAIGAITVTYFVI